MTQQKILVCGAGIAGMACALGLAKKAFTVDVLAPEMSRQLPRHDEYHPRVYAISGASQNFLASLGIWDLMDAARLTPVQAMEIYGDGGGRLALDAWQDARHTLAWIVESGEIERALRQALKVYGVRWHDDQLASRDGEHIHTESGKTLDAQLLVGADGAKSTVRRVAEIWHDFKAYGDSGLVTHLTTELPHQGVALQWFTGDAVVALLPMPDTDEGPQVSLVWSGPTEQIAELMALNDEDKAQRLQQWLMGVTQGRLGNMRVRSKMFAFPLTFERTGMVAEGVALVGDAAHRVHPLAGQGLNLGLGDVEELIRVLAAKPVHQSVGALPVLERYKRRRAEPIAAMRAVTDSLHSLFMAQQAPVAWARNAGMSIINQLPFIKRRLIANAAGDKIFPL
ncbi:FAD-dependent monooxygenase [Paenalcaligenes sp. Me131]|uniref:FAD-dependent monooxygenase n=1 Tax=Paenalcaligenes sp. Me131 TaxID=3392636 RepID=UPI003D2DD036